MHHEGSSRWLHSMGHYLTNHYPLGYSWVTMGHPWVSGLLSLSLWLTVQWVAILWSLFCGSYPIGHYHVNCYLVGRYLVGCCPALLFCGLTFCGTCSVGPVLWVTIPWVIILWIAILLVAIPWVTIPWVAIRGSLSRGSLSCGSLFCSYSVSYLLPLHTALGPGTECAHFSFVAYLKQTHLQNVSNEHDVRKRESIQQEGKWATVGTNIKAGLEATGAN